MGRRAVLPRMGLVVAAALTVVASACSSSGGPHTGSGLFEVRPLIMPARHATGGRADPFGSLHVPAEEDAYGRLSSAAQADLADALRAVDCAHPPKLAGTHDRVVCDTTSYAYLLGAPTFTGHDVTHATPVPPPPDGSRGWQIQLMLTSAGADKESQWTSQHHVQSMVGEYNPVQTSSIPPCGTTTRTPCSDYTAYLVDDSVVTVTVSATPFSTAVLFDVDSNTNASTARLARKIAG